MLYQWLLYRVGVLPNESSHLGRWQLLNHLWCSYLLQKEKKIIFAICFKGLQTIPKLGRGTGLESKLLGMWGTFFGCFVLLLSNWFIVSILQMIFQVFLPIGRMLLVREKWELRLKCPWIGIQGLLSELTEYRKIPWHCMFECSG